ncbi:MAG: GNAT family N-acetyltransferase [Acidobacteria bacterium]|nr:GNAT family N-acetyltransferase [Acidobacteriota bacterium]
MFRAAPLPPGLKRRCARLARGCGRFARWRLHTRRAMLRDAEPIHRLISEYSGDGTLLPRSFADVCENIRDFFVVEDGGAVIGCGALHIYGPHLCEVRSIAVAPRARGQRAGRSVVRALIRDARRHGIDHICLFTRIPRFFSHLGFVPGRPEDLPDKIFKDCLACPRLHCCDEVPMVYGHAGAETGISISRPAYARPALVTLR